MAKGKGRCSDPRGVKCKNPVQIYAHKVCRNCYQWLRDNGKIQCRPYMRKVPRGDHQA